MRNGHVAAAEMQLFHARDGHAQILGMTSSRK